MHVQRASVSLVPIHARVRKAEMMTSALWQQQLRYRVDADDDDDDDDVVDDDASEVDRCVGGNGSLLERNTRDILDLEVIPLGDLRQEDVSSITNLMMAWAKTKRRRGALMAERLLKRIIDDVNLGNEDVKVTTRLYTICIDNWAKVGGVEAAGRAQQIHDGLVAKSLETGDDLIAPSTVSYNALLNCWSKSKSPNSPDRAEKIIDEMIGRGVRPDVVSFTSAIDCVAKAGRSTAGDHGLRLFRQMESLAAQAQQNGRSSESPGLQPNIYTYSALANAIAKGTDADAPQKALALLDEMKQKSREGDWQLTPTVVVYNSVINCLVRRKGPGMAQKASEILDRMIEDGVEPDSLSWKLVTTAWAQSDDEGSIEKAEEILLRSEKWALAKMKEIEQTSALPRHRVWLDRDAYNAVLKSLSRAQECDDAAQRALAILRRMRDLGDSGMNGLRPNIYSWNIVLNTIAATREAGIAAKAESVLGYMIREKNTMPDRFSFTAVLNTYQRNPEQGSAARADAIVRQMQKLYLAGDIKDPPDVYHFTILLTCWAKSRERIAARRCKQILNFMHNENIEPNTRAYNAVIESHARSQDVEEAEAILDHLILASPENPSLSPDEFSFRSVIAAWTRSRRRDAGRRAVAVLDKYLNFMPDAKASKPFALIIEWFSKRRDQPDSAMMAETLLDRMLDLHEQNGHHPMVPLLYACINVINAHAASRQPDSGKAAERVYSKYSNMLNFTCSQKHDLSRLRQTVIVSNAVISALASSGERNASERAESILNELVASRTANADSYQGVIIAWAKSRRSGKAQHAYRILHRMIDDFKGGNRNCRPTAQVYTAVINAAAFSNGDRKEEQEAFEIATNTLNELYNCTHCDTNAAAMGTFIKACGRLEVSADILLEKSIEETFREACRLGIVDRFVLTQMYWSCSDGLYKKLLGELIPGDGPEKVKIDTLVSIPEDWRRNVREAKAP